MDLAAIMKERNERVASFVEVMGKIPGLPDRKARIESYLGTIAELLIGIEATNMAILEAIAEEE